MKIIFARHGVTEKGREERFEGVSDSPLTDQGKLQAKKIAEFCKEQNIEKIYSSPVQRVVATAEIVSEILSLPVIYKEELREICYGTFEGKKRSELEKLLVWKSRNNNFFQYIHPGTYEGKRGESYQMLYERLVPFFKTLHLEHKNIVIISHLGIIRCAVKFYENKSDQELRDFRIHNATVYIP